MDVVRWRGGVEIIWDVALFIGQLNIISCKCRMTGGKHKRQIIIPPAIVPSTNYVFVVIYRSFGHAHRGTSYGDGVEHRTSSIEQCNLDSQIYRLYTAFCS